MHIASYYPRLINDLIKQGKHDDFRKVPWFMRACLLTPSHLPLRGMFVKEHSLINSDRSDLRPSNAESAYPLALPG
jgi:hypothetical protein